jgi:eukaryotic-like serine/threonine-protein kinase
MSRRSGSDEGRSAAASLAGSVFAGQWRVLRRTRASGSLYVAEQVSTGRPCALRVLDASLASDDRGRVRFEATAALRAKVASDHVVELLDAGIERKGSSPWFALAWLDGESLADRARTAMSFEDAHEALAQLAHGLDALRDAGVRHAPLMAEDVIVTKARYSGSPFTVVIPDVWVTAWAASAKGVQAPDDLAPHLASFARVAFRLLTSKDFGDDGSTGDVTPSARADELGCARALPADFDAWFARCHRGAGDDAFTSASVAVEALSSMLVTETQTVDAAPSEPRPVKRRPPSKLAANLRRADYLVPAVLALSLVLALGVRQIVRARRARIARDARAVAAARIANTPTPTPAAQPAAPAAATPPRLDEATLRDLQSRLSSTGGAQPVWIAVAASDPAATQIAERLQTAFERAGWRTHPIQRSDLRARPGLFVFAADERSPSYVESAVRALGGAGLAPTVATGYRAFYNERVRTTPDYRGIRLDADQTWVIAVGRGQ